MNVSLEPYLNIESSGGANFSKNGEYATFVYDSTGVFQIYKTKVKENENSWPIRLTASEDRCTNPKYLSDDTILYLSDKGGNENFQMHLIDTTGKVHQISDNLTAKYRINKITEKYVYYSSNTVNKSVFATYRRKIPLLEHKEELVYQPDSGLYSVSCVNSTDSILILSEFLANTHVELFLFDLKKQLKSSITSKLNSDRRYVWIPIKFIDDSSVLVYSNYNSDFNRLGILNMDGTYIPLVGNDKISGEISAVIPSNSGDFYLMITNQSGISKFYEIQINGSKITEFRTLNLEGDVVYISGDARSFTSGASISEDESKILLSISSSDKPMRVICFDRHSGKSWDVTLSSIPGLNNANFVKAELKQFNSFDGLEVSYFKFSSEVIGVKPTIFMIHGGPESQFRPSFSPLIQFFTANGYNIIAPNIRGSSGFGRTFMDLDNVEKRLDSIKDIKALRDHLIQTDSTVDAGKLIIYGGSYGGFAVLSAITEYPEDWKAAVDIVGISNFVTFLENTADWRRKLREAEYGSLENDRELLHSISPIHKVDKIKSALFIIQGDNDERVPLSESLQMYDNLFAKGLPVKLLRFADEGHGVVKRSNKIKAYSEVVNWLNKVL